MDFTALVTWIGKALLRGALGKVAQYGVRGIVDWAEEQAKSEGLVLSDVDKLRIVSIFSEDRSFWSALAAQFKTVRRRGIAIVGPSGGGKTSLCNFLCGRPIAPSHSTAERVGDETRFGARYIRVMDTPGSQFHVNLETETYQFVEEAKIDVLVVVLAYGYLDTIGIRDLRRPGMKKPYTSLERYLDRARREEVEWLQAFAERVEASNAKIPYCMVVINKMDHWWPPDAVLKHYQKGKAKTAIESIVRQLCRKGAQASLHSIHCSYNSFKGAPPVGDLSTESALLTLSVLRAELAARMSEILE